ncbi:nicotinate-nucleotide--dimethylbenzimidazole phosphoribosyltransferase [Amycolatopsis endophytica]|uniref:Nicotinate-nucleotide--dimethylbenzimidazole phosphoribosyltransferase n=1 Tax=Amycolatopsis endophytica TaxID=860233 RepID=A0A853B635_9PSEU|nr:nicotinate-nucleotide--dimethylbenzimidazole phosphoribosyltransferase [Amycolatopsis endophytica]NYI90275.1 nicotinate-nucleotide--dimethylbenzimidazole phosphoribosyltransferase [Amycolatopsis endophytica]
MTDVSFADVPGPDEASRAEAVRRHEELLKPAGSLGELEGLGEWVAACQGAVPPRRFQRPRVIVFAGDHGIAAKGVSAYRPEVTGQLVDHLLKGVGPVAVAASVADAGLRVVDIAVTGETPVAEYRVRAGSGSIDVEDALTEDEVNAALRAGAAIADAEVDEGADLLVAGSVGVGASTPAAVLVAALTGAEPVAVVGRGSGIDDDGWMRKTLAVRDALRRARAVLPDPVALLRTAGGADLAALTGFLAQAAVRRTPVLLDGLAVAAAALVAEELAPGARSWWQAAHADAEPAHRMVLEHLDLKPIVDLGLRLGDGTGAATALPLLITASRLLTDLPTHAEAGVSAPNA